MIDTHPCATPTPAQPVTTVTSTATPPPPPDPLPHAVGPAVTVTDPVSNFDFLPVDDAFALEFRSETIEQLVGGDALRRGVSERIEAGRSQTNADLVAGRDRVRVHATLHEHTGHALAEQSAHLHTTVDGTLDVHAGNEDTVLLAGHMREVWDGGAAIVAAMTDDTVAGGGIRVTTPLDLWVHGLMGVEERIGTCTADAVLMELGATHYEREYGPGVHAAGLAVYTGSLYQSSRSSFRPLMRVSSGVRNLIAAGDGGGAAHGAGGAPGASPPSVPAQTAAAEESASATLAAGRRTAEAPATALDTPDALTVARRAPLETLVDSVDARMREDMGEAGTVMHAEGLPELTGSADTAEQLGALREALRMDAAVSGSEAAGGFRAWEFESAVSMHPASGGCGPLEIDPPSAVHGGNVPMVLPHPGVPWGEGPEMKLGLPGGADRPPQPAAPESDFHAAYRRLRELRSHYYHTSRADILGDYHRTVDRISRSVLRKFDSFGGKPQDLTLCSGLTKADRAYDSLQETARRAERAEDPILAGAIRAALDALDRQAVETLQALTTKYGMFEAPFTRAVQRPPAATERTATVAAIPPPARTPIQIDWFTAYRQLRGLMRRFSNTGHRLAFADFHSADRRVTKLVERRFTKFGGKFEHLPPAASGVTRTQRTYLALQDMARGVAESDHAARAYEIRLALEHIDQYTIEALDRLTRKYGVPDARLIEAVQRPPVTAGFPVIGASTTVPRPSQFDIPGPAYPIDVSLNPVFTEPAGGLVHATDIPGPSLSEAAGAEARGIWRGWLDPPATVSGATAAHRAATEAIVTPALGGTSPFRLQPADPVPAPGPVPFESGPNHAGETVRPPPVATTASSTAPAPGAAFHVPSWPDHALRVERRLLAGELPFAHREAIALQFRVDGALLEAEYALHTHIADALGWPATRRDEVLADIFRLHDAIVRSHSATAAARIDVDWRAIEALVRILDIPPPSP